MTPITSYINCNQRLYGLGRLVCAFSIAVITVMLVPGCAGYYTSLQESVKPPAIPAIQAERDRPDTLSYGMVTGRVKKNQTTQQDLLELFGGPNTMTTDRDGTEVWMYEKTATTTSGSYASGDSSVQKNDTVLMASFFGLGIPIGIAGGGLTSRSEDASVRQGQSSFNRSVRTITFIVKFNQNKTVKDYSVRQASY